MNSVKSFVAWFSKHSSIQQIGYVMGFLFLIGSVTVGFYGLGSVESRVDSTLFFAVGFLLIFNSRLGWLEDEAERLNDALKKERLGK